MSKINYQKTIEWYECHASEYAQKSTLHSSIDKSQLEEFANYLPHDGKVLDAGCGSGRDAAIFHELGFDVVGIDITRSLLAEAKKNHPNVDLRIGDLLSLEFPDNTFDGVWAHASIVHFETDQQIVLALSEVMRVLKPNGILHLLVRAKNSDQTIEVRPDSIAGQGRLYYHFTKEALREQLEQRGIKLIKLEQYNESDRDPHKRPGEGIAWLLALGRKI